MPIKGPKQTWTGMGSPYVPVPRPGRRVPADLAYHPKGLPPAGALPSLTQMADPECKTNVRAQRSFASVAQLGSWLELIC